MANVLQSLRNISHKPTRPSDWAMSRARNKDYIISRVIFFITNELVQLAGALEKLARVEHLSLLSPFVSYKENKVL